MILQRLAALSEAERDGLERPETISRRSELGDAYRKAGRIDDAIGVFGQVVADMERLLGATAPEPAVPLLERVAADRERLFGSQSVDALDARNALATARFEAGRPDTARTQLADCERAIPDAELTAVVRDNLAAIAGTTEDEGTSPSAGQHDWQPPTDLERALYEAARRDDRIGYLRLLAGADLYVDVDKVALDADGEEFWKAFKERPGVRAVAVRTIGELLPPRDKVVVALLRLRSLAKRWPSSDHAMLVNPGTPAEMSFTAGKADLELWAQIGEEFPPATGDALLTKYTGPRHGPQAHAFACGAHLAVRNRVPWNDLADACIDYRTDQESLRESWGVTATSGRQAEVDALLSGQNSPPQPEFALGVRRELIRRSPGTVTVDGWRQACADTLVSRGASPHAVEEMVDVVGKIVRYEARFRADGLLPPHGFTSRHPAAVRVHLRITQAKSPARRPFHQRGQRARHHLGWSTALWPAPERLIMKRIVASGAALAAALVAAAVALPGGTASARVPSHPTRNGPHFFTTKTPYAPQERLSDYQSAPKGFVPVFAENVVRHGSRAMTDSDDGDAVLAVLQAAQARGALTGLGARLGPQVQTVLAGGSSIGFGNLAGRGKQEQQGIALRMERRMPALFSAIVAKKEPVAVVTSGVDRAVASANAFTGGLATGDPALTGLIQAPVTNKDLLYFHKQPQNADYQAYLDSDPDLAAVLATIDGEPGTAKAAKHVVSRLFNAGFIAAMSADDQISFSRSLYELYSAAPDLSVEAPNVDLDAFLPAEDARWFAYLDDAEEFYEKGPAFSGRTITYDMAGVLLDDLFAKAEARAGGTSDTGAVLRFTHAEEIEPLAVLLGLPGSTKAAAPARPYSYQNNPWRGATVAPMAANVEWDLYAGTPRSGKGTEYLVRMLYNEKETAFKSACKPVTRGSHFYDLNELKRCFDKA